MDLTMVTGCLLRYVREFIHTGDQEKLKRLAEQAIFGSINCRVQMA
jgi:hypothetical protein